MRFVKRWRLPQVFNPPRFPIGEVLREEEGSAVVEFIVLALPLLIPLTIYLGIVHSNSTINSDLHNLARQSARAFITSPDEGFEEARITSVLNEFESRVFIPNGISEIPKINIECSATPCLTPDARVKVTATIDHHAGSFSGIFRFISTPAIKFSASDTQIVDAWR